MTDFRNTSRKLSVRIKIPTYQKMVQIAERERRSKSWVINEALEKYHTKENVNVV